MSCQPSSLVVSHRAFEGTAQAQAGRGEQRGRHLAAGQQLLRNQRGLVSRLGQALHDTDPIQGDLAEPEQVELPRPRRGEDERQLPRRRAQ